jgi:hypothetical protein
LKYLVVPLLMAVFLFGEGTVRSAAADEGVPWTEAFSLSGWADAIQSIRTHAPNDSLTSRARLRLELSAVFDSIYGFVSADAEKNRQIDEETGTDLHEVWIEHAAGRWDLRIGRQIIIWGKADGVQITDIISPPDYTESITRDLDEIRMPVNAVKFRLLGDHVDTELIWIPVFKPAVQPSGDNPWAIKADVPENMRMSFKDTVEPDTSLENSEIALKVAAYLSGLDIAASVFYTWDDYPTYHRSTHSEGDTLFVDYAPRHHRLTVLGLEFSRPWSDFVFRGEAAYYLGKYHETKKIDMDPIQRDLLKWLGGVDWTPGNDWTVTAQLTGDGIIDHDDRLADPSHALTATLNISKQLLHQTLTVSNMVYWSIDEDEIFDRINAEYEWTDAVHLLVGADIFCGDDGQFGVYEDNSQMWVKVKYSF